MAMSSLRCTKNNAVYMAELGVVAMLLLLTLASTSVHAEQGPNAARYDNYRLYRVRFENTEQVAIFQELERVSDSCIFYGHARQVGQSLTILVSAHKTADFAKLLDRFAVEHAILNHNFQEAIDDQFRSVQPKTTPGNRLNWRHYFHLDTIHAWLDHLVESQPDFVQPLDIGRSFGGRQLRGVKLSRRRPGAEQLQRPGIFVEAGIHAREWISPATSTFLINQLVHSTDARVRELADAFDWYFVPVVNPDGYAFTFDSDRMWRKTRQPNGLCVGTDMNRNFDSHWNSIGSSSDPCAYDYAGRAVFSEPEAAAISTWMRANRNASRIDTYITLHSFSQLLLFPHSHTDEPVPNHADLLAIGREGVRALAGRYGTDYQTGSAYETIYPSSGGSMDWAYDEQRVPIAFTMELRGPPDSEVMFNLPADQIEPVGWETLDAIVAMLTEARRLGYYGSGEEACAAETAKV